MGPKDAELLCLEKVIQAIPHQHGKSKAILKMCASPELSRKESECPDFVKCCSSRKNGEKGILLGIEHFQVDHYAIEQRTGKIGATVNAYLKKDNERAAVMREHINPTGELPDDAIQALAESVGAALQMRYKANYNLYVKSFEYSLNKHLKHVDGYLKNLRSYSGGDYYIELAFLIEIYADFRNVFLSRNNHTDWADNSFIPIFSDIACMLEGIDYRKVKFLIFCITNPVVNCSSRIVAVETRALRSQLEKQHIPIYNYAGEGRSVDIDRVVSSYKRYEDRTDFIMTIPERKVNVEKKMDIIIPAFLKALEFKKLGEPFATTQSVQFMLELFGDYYIQFEDLANAVPNELWKYVISNHGAAIWNKMQEIEHQWYPQKAGIDNGVS